MESPGPVIPPIEFEKPQIFWWQRLLQRLTAMPWAARLMTNRLHLWDRWLYRLTGERWTATEILAGLPVIFVTSIGRITGLKRTTPLLAIKEDDKFIVIATKFGSDHHPHWYFNMVANPNVEVLYMRKQFPYFATQLEGEERRVAWARAVAFYPGYSAYEQRAHNRRIPVLRLSPLPPPTS